MNSVDCVNENAQIIHRFTVWVNNIYTKPLSATNQVGSVRIQLIVNWSINFLSDELMSGKADWLDTTNTLNSTVKIYNGV